MSDFEISLIVLFCAVPFLSLLFVLPKKIKKKDKKTKVVEAKPAEAKPVEDEKPKEVKPEYKPLQETMQKKPTKQTSEIFDDDFENFIKNRPSTSRPSRVEMPKDFMSRTMPYIPNRRSSKVENPKNITEEIQNLSPELKALIIAGVLDPKNFDNM